VGFAAAERDPRVTEPNGNRVAAKQAKMQNFDGGAFDETHFQKTAFKLDGANAAIGRDVFRRNTGDHTGITKLCGVEPDFVLFCGIRRAIYTGHLFPVGHKRRANATDVIANKLHLTWILRRA
jgi:hypothetical protein